MKVNNKTIYNPREAYVKQKRTNIPKIDYSSLYGFKHQYGYYELLSTEEIYNLK